MSVEFIGVQLAKPWEAWPVGTSYVYVEPKFDGFRLVAIIQEDGEVAFFCREKEPPTWIEHLGHIASDIRALGLEPGTMLDGEVMGDDWNQTSSLLRRKREDCSDEELQQVTDKVKLYVFDHVDLTCVELVPPVGRQRKVRHADMRSQETRRGYLETLFVAHDLASLDVGLRSSLRLVPSFKCSSEDEVMARYAWCCNEFEGAIVKLPHANYVFDRTTAWLKLKPSTTRDMTIIGAVEGTGKHVGRLGALLCEDENGAKVRVGTGFSDAEREKFWAEQDLLLGVRVEVSHQTSKVAGARHPVFHKLRDIG